MTQVSNEGRHNSVETVVQRIVIFFVIVAVALVVGYSLAIALIPTPKIGIIDVQSQVGGPLVEVMSQEINYAREARDIKGVVLVINSPGGGASSGHDIYYQVRRFR